MVQENIITGQLPQMMESIFLIVPNRKQTAVQISQTLFKSLEWAKEQSVEEVRKRVVDTLNAVDGLEVEYYEIVDKTTLQPTGSWHNAIGCVTVYCGPVRLIDNIQY